MTKYLLLLLVFISFPSMAKDPLDKLVANVNKHHGKQYRGVASWYGPGFHGRKTASGERFNMHTLTAAHKTLPMNCLVKVTNPNNGKSVVVKINDRGPFHGNRVLDLSKAAASKLDIIKHGHGKIEYKVIGYSK